MSFYCENVLGIRSKFLEAVHKREKTMSVLENTDIV